MLSSQSELRLTQSSLHIAALEVEDLDIGYDDDLAGDVDDGEEDNSHDPEALDTDDDEDEDEKLGIDSEETEGASAIDVKAPAI